jgi:tetratricopeptide (TPR) repeat protein
MKKLEMILVAASFLACAAAQANARPIADPPGPEKLQAAQAAEEKGDLARVHSNYQTAEGFYWQALRVTPKNAVLYNKLGIAELQMGERGAARKHFSQSLKLDPKNCSVMNNLGAVAYLDRKYRPAIGYFKQALALDETVASTHLNLAEAWLGLGDTQRAMNEYTRALELDADVLSSNPDGIQARITTPEQRARVSYTIAKLYAKRGNLEGALEYLRRAKDGRYPDLAKVYTDQDFAPLWQDPRLAKIVKR